MKKVILRLDCGIGMNSADSFLVTAEEWAEYTTGTNVNDHLSLYAWDAAVQFADGYGIYPESERPEEFDWDEDRDCYSDDIDGWFELYDPDEHDGLMIGTQREWDWREL